jgi:hypothetical protein
MSLYYFLGAMQVRTWFTMPDSTHHLGQTAWSSDGQQLSLVVFGPFCLDNCDGYALPDVYLYTPPSMA